MESKTAGFYDKKDFLLGFLSGSSLFMLVVIYKVGLII